MLNTTCRYALYVVNEAAAVSTDSSYCNSNSMIELALMQCYLLLLMQYKILTECTLLSPLYYQILTLHNSRNSSRWVGRSALNWFWSHALSLYHKGIDLIAQQGKGLKQIQSKSMEWKTVKIVSYFCSFEFYLISTISFFFLCFLFTSSVPLLFWVNWDPNYWDPRSKIPASCIVSILYVSGFGL